MNSKLLLITACAVALQCGIATAVAGQTSQADAVERRGAITGQIRGDDNLPLYNATVTLPAFNRWTSTNRQGYFRLAAVPEGNHQVIVSYLGYAPDTLAAVVAADQPVELAVGLKLSPFAVEGIVVTAISRSQVAALNEQRTAPNIKNVVAEEQFERMPDLSVADALARVPGVGSTYDAATGYLGYEAGTPQTSNISLRGMAAGSSVTVDGQSVPSTSSTGRDAELAGISLQSLESIEVIKALTPDMDADAVGGSINLRTRRPSAPRISGSFGGSYNGLAGDPNLQGSLGYENLFGNTALMLDGNYSTATSTYDLVTNSWGLRNFGNGPERTLDRFTVLTASGTQKRVGATANVQHQLSKSAALFVRGAAHRYTDANFSQFVQLRPGSGTFQSNSASTGGDVRRRIQFLPNEIDVYSVSAGGDNSIGGLELDYNAGYALSARSVPDAWGSFENRLPNVDMAWDRSDPLFTQYQITNGVSLTNPSSFPISSIQRRDDETRDRELTGGLNIVAPLIQGDFALELKAGGKFTGRNRSRDYTRTFRDLPSGMFSMNEISDGSDLNRSITPGGYRIGITTDWDRVEQFLGAHEQLLLTSIDQTQSDAGDHEIREDVSAGYAMATATWKAFMLLGGVRYEHTQNAYTGNRTAFDRDGAYVGTNAVESRSSNDGFFPMVHVRYSIDERTNLRFAWTNTIERAPFDQLAPTENIDYESELISRGNPDLLPARSQNIDLLAERYFRSGGIISGGLFFKSIDDFGSQMRSIIVGGELDGFDLVQWQNTGRAKIWGAEVSLVQGLQFLPGVLQYLSFNANYAYAHSKIKYGEERELPMTNQAPHIVNFALNLDVRGLEATAAASYQSEKLAHIGTSDLLDMYLYRPVSLDLSVRQRIREGVKLFANGRNVTGAPSYTFAGSRDFPQRATYSSWTATAGVRVDF